ncbi:MAG: DUF2252 domain-containing protein [Acidimicrobiales bacterium]
MTLPTPDERAAHGRKARELVPRSRHGEWETPADRTDPLEILALQATTRVPDLVPIRYGRMAASPFAFFRGAAAVMAADLALEEHSQLDVQLCGDAHLVNFGGFASPERDFIFDVNDFDETIPGPFEWDLKRLAASVEVAARSRGFDDALRRSLVAGSVRGYREAIRDFATMGNLGIWYSKLDGDHLTARWGNQAGKAVMANLTAQVAKAKSKDHLRAVAKLTEEVDGKLRFRADPPLLVPADQLFDPDHSTEVVTSLLGALSEYRATLSGDRQHLLGNYEFMDLARKVVGVGSVGTRCWVALFIGRDHGDPLVLQVKEAEHSVAEPFLAPSAYANMGQRVVEGQRLVQSSSDIFLGWDAVPGVDGVERDFYFRQMWDWKASADIESMRTDGMAIYVQMCGWVLALGHARSGDAIAIGSYLGAGDRFDEALCDFASSYADQNQKDYQALKLAIATNQVHAISDV